MTSSSATDQEILDLLVSRDGDGAFLRADGITVRLTDERALTLVAALLIPGAGPHTVGFKCRMPIPSPADIAQRSAPAPETDSGSRVPGAVYSTGEDGTTDLPQTAQEALDLAGPCVKYIPTGRRYAELLGVTDEDIQRICQAPEGEWLSDSAEVFYVIGEGVGLTVSTRDGAILGVRHAEDMGRFRPRTLPSTPRGRGGVGNRYPVDTKSLISWLRKSGFTVGRASNGHYEVSRDGHSVQIASSPGDHRSVINGIKMIESAFDVDLSRGAQ